MGYDMASLVLQDVHHAIIDLIPGSCNRLTVPLEDRKHVTTKDANRALIGRSTLTRVRTGMASLPEEQRSAVMLVCVDGLNYQQAAAKLGIPVGTLMSRLCRGRLELARYLSASKWNIGT